MEDKISAATRYKALEKTRQGPLDRARKNAILTVPWVMPPEGADEQTELKDPFQNIGGEGVEHLAAKMTLAVMPPNEPFFRHDADDFAADEAEAQAEGTKTDARQKLAKYDRAVMRRIEASGDRQKVNLANLHLLVTGNVLLDFRHSKTRVIGMDSYVVLRDPRGTPLEIVIKEKVHPEALPEALRKAIQAKQQGESKGGSSGETSLLDLYTFAHLKDGKYAGFQEVEGEKVAGSEFEKKPEDFGLVPLRFTVVDGQSWGRSFAEGCSGDLQTLETLTQAITDTASAASKVVFLVRPNGVTRVKDLKDAENFDFIPGDDADVTVLRLDKSADLQIALRLMGQIEERLKDRFLLRSGVTRDAERVTAEEIRYVALEIDDALSGIYSLLTQEFQLPYVRLKIKQMKDLPNLPQDVVNLTITTGLEALRRGHEMQKLRMWVEGMTAAYGPEVVGQMVPREEYAKRLADSLGLDFHGLLRSETEAQQAALTDKATDAAIQAAPSIIQGQTQ